MRVKLSVFIFSLLFIFCGMTTRTAEGPEAENKEEKEMVEKESVVEEKTSDSAEVSESEQEEIEEEKEEVEATAKEETETEEADEDEEGAEGKEVEEKKEDAGQEEKPEKVIGFDTIGIKEPEGNWLLKRAWWEKAQKKYEKIKNVVAKIVESRMQFFKRRNDLDRNVFDPFYSNVGLSQGQLEEVISHLMGKVEKERKEEHGLSVEERDYLSTLTAEKRTLEQMKLDVVGIRKLDIAIDEDLDKLMEQINLSRKYEEQAWQLFKGIAKVLNHKKARELYHKMDTFWTNVKDINGYINGAFKNHFNSVVRNAKAQVDRLKTAADAFKQKGVDLKKQFDKIQEEEEAEERGPEEKTELDQDQDEENEEALHPDQVGWFGSIYNAITWPFRKIWSLISSLWK